ncbi:MAG: DoxX family protein [Gammaproteobacteria bacterium]|nr:DoxX family protein [Gammaproteobacteria bacterium]
MTVMTRIADVARPAIRGLEFLSPLLDLALRLWVAKFFWDSGLTKIASWDTTVMLFTYEYHVPLLAPAAAAALGTFVELTFPVLLVFGIGTRLSALILFCFNFIAVISYPDLSEVGLKDHTFYGILLLVIFFHGPGKLSIDHWLRRKWM